MYATLSNTEFLALKSFKIPLTDFKWVIKDSDNTVAGLNLNAFASFESAPYSPE